MAFKLDKTIAPALDSPETLFRDIKTKKIPGPLADQADLWRAYLESAVQAPDVALQLPTGGGKTLVGLVLAEWQRQKFGARVVFLCPTRQLVNQVVAQATNQYGLKVHGFTGSNKEYSKESVADYRNCERIAVITYSSLFNTYAFFDDAQIIILDDAHASEQYIAGMWSLTVDRFDETHRQLYESIVAVLKPAIPGTDFQRLVAPETTLRDRAWVEKLPTPTLEELAATLVRVIDANVTATDHKFTWPVIRDHLVSCHLYLGAGKLLIRPLIPPTNTHRPFVSARQRIYMSATFGTAGELERITGRPKILRLQAKASWDRQTIGRRYFLFPERSLSENEQLTLCKAMIQQAGRALVLTPDERRAKAFRDFVDKYLGIPIFNAQDVEKSKLAFVSSKNAVAIVANRYDGIDFPRDECRLLIVEGLPRATNLQEQFLITRMGAIDLLNVRITTRLVQAFGRCTRSDEDYSAVIVRGEELNKHLMAPERRGFLHPELHAELDFGIEQAKGTSIETYMENFSIFLAQGDDWRAANAEIVSKRDALNQDVPPGAANLEATASFEIEYELAIWHGDYVAAFEHARSILGLLEDPKLRGYRAFWHYLAGSAAWLAHKSGVRGFDSRAREQFSAALKAEKTIAWLVRLARLGDSAVDQAAIVTDKDVWSIIERLEALFDELGTMTDYKYDKFEAEIRGLIEQNDAKAFEQGHAKLGTLLGYEAGNRNVTASPDPWWLANSSSCLIFEDHTDSKPDAILSVDKARQVCTHPTGLRKIFRSSQTPT